MANEIGVATKVNAEEASKEYRGLLTELFGDLDEIDVEDLTQLNNAMQEIEETHANTETYALIYAIMEALSASIDGRLSRAMAKNFIKRYEFKIKASELTTYSDAVRKSYISTMARWGDTLVKETIQEIRGVLTELMITNRAKEINEAVKLAKRESKQRATFIGVNEAGNLSALINKAKAEALGADSYIWRTVRDTAVRDRHKAINGEVYKYGEATGAEGGLAPSEPFRCRCYAEVILSNV